MKPFFKIFAATTFAFLMLVSLVSGQVATGTGVTAPRQAITLERLVLDMQVDGGTVTSSFIALKLSTGGPYAWAVDSGIFGSGAYQTPNVWVLLKNRSSTGAEFVGRLVYQNASSTYAIARNASTTSPIGWWNSSGIWVVPLTLVKTTGSVISQPTVALLGVRGSGSTIRPNVTKVLTTIPEAYGDWKFYLRFTSPASATANFRNSFTTTVTNKATFQRPLGTLVSQLPFCSPIGSCIKTTEFTSTAITVRRATQYQSLD